MEGGRARSRAGQGRARRSTAHHGQGSARPRPEPSAGRRPLRLTAGARPALTPKNPEGGRTHRRFLLGPSPQPPAQLHFRAAPALFRAAAGSAQGASRADLPGHPEPQGGRIRPSPALLRAPPPVGAPWGPRLAPTRRSGVAVEARGAASRAGCGTGGASGRPRAAGKLGGGAARSGGGACDLRRAGASCRGVASGADSGKAWRSPESRKSAEAPGENKWPAEGRGITAE